MRHGPQAYDEGKRCQDKRGTKAGVATVQFLADEVQGDQESCAEHNGEQAHDNEVRAKKLHSKAKEDDSEWGMQAAKLLPDEELETMERAIAAEIDSAVRQALSEEEPLADSLTQGVYCDA